MQKSLVPPKDTNPVGCLKWLGELVSQKWLKWLGTMSFLKIRQKNHDFRRKMGHFLLYKSQISPIPKRFKRILLLMCPVDPACCKAYRITVDCNNRPPKHIDMITNSNLPECTALSPAEATECSRSGISAWSLVRYIREIRSVERPTGANTGRIFSISEIKQALLSSSHERHRARDLRGAEKSNRSTKKSRQDQP